MKIITQLVAWLGKIFDAWVTRIGKESRPKSHDFDHIVEIQSLTHNLDKFTDENGNFT